MSIAAKERDSLLKRAFDATHSEAYAPTESKTQPDRALSVLKRIPLVSGILEKATDTSHSFLELAKFEGDGGASANSALLGLHGLGLGLTAVNVFSLPFGYAMCRLRGVTPPYRFTDKAKWLYSSGALSLAIVALLFPPSAPFIGVGLAGTSTALSFFFLGKTAFDYFKLRRQLKKANEELAKLEAEEKSLIEAIRYWQDLVANPTTSRGLSAGSTDSVDELRQHLNKLDVLSEKLVRAKTHQQNIQQEMKELNFLHVLDRGIGFGFASLALIGVIVSLFFPLPGIIILSAVGGTALLYTAARFGIPLALKLGGWLYGKMNAPKASPPHSSLDENTPVHESTLDIEAQITESPAQAAKALKNIAEGQDDALIKTPAPPKAAPVVTPHPELSDKDEDSEGEHPHL